MCFSVGLVVLLAIRYMWQTMNYHKGHMRSSEGGQVPQYPTFVPFLGTIVSAAWNLPGYVERVT